MRIDDLLLLLAVVRHGKFTAAGDDFGVNHTTISRRIAALERSLGGRVLVRGPSGWQATELGARAVRVAEQIQDAVTDLAPSASDPAALSDVVRITATDGFSAYVIAPAAARLRDQHPDLRVEIVTTTRRAIAQPGLDLEVVVGEPQVHRASAVRLADYVLGLYVSRSYLRNHSMPDSRAELAGHRLVYFVDSMLQVDGLDVARREVPNMRDAVTSTNVFVHVEATRTGAGLGLLPCFMADRHDDLVRILDQEVNVLLSYWLVSRAESVRRPAVAAVIEQLRSRVTEMAPALRGEKVL